jgi:hypothetical protein
MPRASWRGYLRLSLVSCPIYLSPAASRTKPIRLRQVWRPGLEDEGDQSPEAARAKQVTEPSLPDPGGHDGCYDADQPQPVTRVGVSGLDPVRRRETVVPSPTVPVSNEGGTEGSNPASSAGESVREPDFLDADLLWHPGPLALAGFGTYTDGDYGRSGGVRRWMRMSCARCRRR